MVTFAYIFTMVLLTIFTAGFDMILFHYGFSEALLNIYNSEVFIGRLFVVIGLVIGFAYSITTDIRLFRKKRRRTVNEES